MNATEQFTKVVVMPAPVRILASVIVNGVDTPVEVMSTYRDGNANMVNVRALFGEPFIRPTHGGWCYDAAANYHKESVRNVHLEASCPACGSTRLETRHIGHQWFDGNEPQDDYDVQLFCLDCDTIIKPTQADEPEPLPITTLGE
jgi:hypothetical protein